MIEPDKEFVLSIIDGKSLKLLYRGSRDGFSAADFHEKCDHLSETIVFIETTTGNAFGGKTSATWDGSAWK